MLRIQDIYNGSRIRINNVNIFNNTVLGSRKMIWMFITAQGSGNFSHPGSGGQKSTGSRIRIRNNTGASPHWFILLVNVPDWQVSLIPSEAYLRKYRKKKCKFEFFNEIQKTLIRIRFEVNCRNEIRIETRNTAIEFFHKAKSEDLALCLLFRTNETWTGCHRNVTA